MATPTDNLTLHPYKCTNKGYTEDLGEGVILTLMLIPAGEFMMGAPEDEPGSRDVERPQHRVKLSQFLMGRYPVTQAQWRVVAGYDREEIDLNPVPSVNPAGTSAIARVTVDIPAGDAGRLHYLATGWNARSIDGSFISKGTIVRPTMREGNTWYVSANSEDDNLPVEQVSWFQAVEFCKRLSTHTGKNYHLPSEAQWEYACRAGTETLYHYGDKISPELGNYSRTVGQTTNVGMYPPNRWGLYDMHGNVEEWCQDYWHENYANAPLGSQAWIDDGDSSRRVVRSSSWEHVTLSERKIKSPKHVLPLRPVYGLLIFSGKGRHAPVAHGHTSLIPAVPHFATVLSPSPSPIAWAFGFVVRQGSPWFRLLPYLEHYQPEADNLSLYH